jgi:hypothetical protein
MTECSIEGGLSISFPEGFRVLTEEEMDAMYLDSNHDRWGIVDEALHVTLCIFYHRSGRIISKLGDAEVVCKNTERNLSKALKGYGYRMSGFRDSEISGHRVKGFSYDYVLRDVEYSCGVDVLKVGNICYTFYRYTRKEGPEAGGQALDGIMSSVKLG